MCLRGVSLRCPTALNATRPRILPHRRHAALQSHCGQTCFTHGSSGNRWLLKPTAKSQFIKRGTAKALCYEITTDVGTTYSIYQHQIFVLLASSINNWNISMIWSLSRLRQYLLCFPAAYGKVLSPGFLSHQRQEWRRSHGELGYRGRRSGCMALGTGINISTENMG
jgi:hypothetical protein